MVVKVINVLRVAGLESKDHPPVRAHGHCVKSPQPALQRMKPPARRIHVRRPAGAIQRCQDQAQPCCMSGLDAGTGAVQKERFQSLMPEAPDQGEV